MLHGIAKTEGRVPEIHIGFLISITSHRFHFIKIIFCTLTS
jgi:hypothetical protein